MLSGLEDAGSAPDSSLIGMAYAPLRRMKTAAFGAGSSRNGMASLGTAPMNRSEESKFGALDVAVIAGMLLLTGGVLALILGFVLK
jgi:hypothetical protein